MRIQTTRNVVITEQPEPDDVLVRVSLMVLGDEPGTRTVRHLPYQPISDYQEAVDWAVSMADKMAYPVHVVPLSHRDILCTGRFDPIRAAIQRMTDQERGEMRRDVVNSMCEVLRDCDDWEVRADAYDVLHQLKVIHHES